MQPGLRDPLPALQEIDVALAHEKYIGAAP
jgi:hypothetical protein